MDSSSSESPEPDVDPQSMDNLTRDQELEAVFNYRPLRLEPQSFADTSPISSPLSFYDKHIDTSLILKRVRVLTTLLLDVPDTVSTAFASMKQQGIEPIFHRFKYAQDRLEDRRRIRPIPNAEVLANLLDRTTTTYGCSVACTMFLGPYNLPKAHRLFNWNTRRGEDEWALDTVKGYLEVNYMTIPSLEGDLKESISQVLRRFPEVVIWIINTVSKEAESLLRLMDTSSGSFDYQVCLTKGYISHSFVDRDIFDGRNAPWRLPKSVKASTDGPWRNTRGRLSTSIPSSEDRRVKGSGRKSRATDKNQQKDLIDIIFPASEARARRCREQADGDATPGRLLQHAWAEAVREDATVIVFSCGNFERIGIRHRRTQTLYLSPLIKTYRCKDPPYGKLHGGLYVAALEDAIDRAIQQSEAEAAKGGPFEAHTDHRSWFPPLPDEGPVHRPRKRRKMIVSRPAGIKSNRDSIILQEAQKRPLALILLRYGVYNSPAPASFLRHNSSSTQRSYRPHEYMTIQLTSRLGRGATGILHGGKMELETSDGQHLVYHVAVKLAFTEKQCTRLEREYGIYRHLAAANVTGIMSVVGLFQDMEGHTLALVMSYGGISLWDREVREGRKPLVTNIISGISPSERSAFLLAMESIHSAGIRHRDIRPANLVVSDDTGEVAIIDFDRAHMDISEDDARNEINKLTALLDGKYFDLGVSSSTAVQSVSSGSERSGSGGEVGEDWS